MTGKYECLRSYFNTNFHPSSVKVEPEEEEEEAYIGYVYVPSNFIYSSLLFIPFYII